MRGRATIDEIRKDREAIIVTEIPYQVNKARMIERIAEMVRDKKIEGISDLRDESDREGVRVVIEIKRDAVAEIVLNQLYRYSPLQTSFGVNMLALTGGKPQQLDLKQILEAFIEFREMSSAGGPSSISTRRETAPTCWSASPSRSPISTRSSRSSAGAKDPVEARIG